jgi:hypothetical protein
MKPLVYTTTNESITVMYEGKPYTVKKGTPNFVNLKKAIDAKLWDEVPDHLTVAKSVQSWSNDSFKIQGSKVTFKDTSIPDGLAKRIVEMASEGADPTALFKFWERLSKNPSFRSVNQLFDFLVHENIPITDDGCFLAYKSVRSDYRDVHSGHWDNRPGNILRMPRNQISDDPQHACHEGFHVGAMGYVRNFHSNGKIIVCKVDPEHVVCVPYDAGQQKMRVCEYKVIGNYGAELPSTTVDVVERYDNDDEEGVGDMEIDEKSPVVTAKLKSKPERKKTERSESKPLKNAPKKNWTPFNKMGMAELVKQSLDDLRKYATYGLEIVGASKIPGGKTALISKILKSR